MLEPLLTLLTMQHQRQQLRRHHLCQVSFAAGKRCAFPVPVLLGSQYSAGQQQVSCQVQASPICFGWGRAALRQWFVGRLRLGQLRIVYVRLGAERGARTSSALPAGDAMRKLLVRKW